MAKKSDYTRFSVYSKKDPSSGDYNIPSYEKDIRNIINNAVKSALPEGAFFQVGEKELTKTGRARWDIFVHTENKALADKSLGTIEQELTFRGGGQKYDITRARPVTAEQAKALFREESAKQNTEESRKLFGAVTKITGLLTSLIVITRRILSNLISVATRTSQDMLTAHNLGMSYESVRNYRYAEKTHGLKEGTITGAVSDIQSKFGNITALDENALSALAVVMGGEIKEAIDMGLGTSNPEKVLGLILDKFNERANAGYNSVGQYVGEQQARRELYSYLLKVSPQIADIFATMQEEQHNINSLYRNQADTFEQWKNIPTGGGGNKTWASYGELKIVSEQWQKISTMIDKIKEGIAVALAPDVVRLLQRIANSRIFMTETEKRALNESNKAKNDAELASIRKTLSGVDPEKLSVGERAYYDVLVEQKKALEKENTKESVDDITTLPADLEARAERRVRKQLKPVTQEGGRVEELANITPAELADVVNAYNLDTPEARQAYRKVREKEVAKAEKEVEKENEEERKRIGKRYFERIAELDKSFNKEKGSVGKARKAFKGNLADQQALMTLYEIGELFPEFEYDLEHGEGNNYTERVYKALERAIADGYAIRGEFGGYTVSKGKYVEDNFVPIQPLNKGIVVDYGNPYLMWLYKQNKNMMTEHIADYRADQAIAEMQKNNSLSATQWLYEEDMIKSVLSKALAGLPSGTYNIRGVNEKTAGGENIYRIVLDVTENGVPKSSRELLSVEGGVGHEGNFASATKKGDNYSLNILSTTASEIAGE